MSIFFEEEARLSLPPKPTLRPGEFVFSAMHMDHNHLIGMVWGLIGAGATLKSFYDPDPAHQEIFLRSFPHAHIALSEEEILQDPDVQLVAAAAVTCQRADLGICVMRAGKDYFTAKAPLTTLEQLEAVRACIRETGRKYQCFYSERLASPSAMLAAQLIRQGAIGRVIHMEGMAPHRLSPASRPRGFSAKNSLADCCATSAPIRWNSTCSFPVSKTPTSRSAALPTMPILITRTLRTSATA